MPSKLKEQARAELQRLAGFDANAAKEELLEQGRKTRARREAMILVRDMEIKAREEADRRARRILTDRHPAAGVGGGGRDDGFGGRPCRRTT